MTKKDFAAKVAAYSEYKALLKETETELAKLEDELKRELDRKGVTEMEVGGHTVRWTPFLSKRFDTKGFKAAEPDLYEAWTKETESRRFSVA